MVANFGATRVSCKHLCHVSLTCARTEAFTQYLGRRREGGQLEGFPGQHAEPAQLLNAEVCEGLVAAQLPMQLARLGSQLLI